MKHVFFDLDHTLWDFEKNSETALRLLYKELDLDEQLRSFNAFHKTYKKINAELWYLYGTGKLSKTELRVKRFRSTLQTFGINDPQLAEKLASGYVETSPYQTNLFPKAQETLTQLQDEGYALHVITNGFKEIQDIKLTNSGIREFFDIVLCSEDVGKSKPAREVFVEALDRANAKPEESIMVGDNLHADVMGAERSGLAGVLFDPHRDHNHGTHEWHISVLDEIPELIPWIRKSRF